MLYNYCQATAPLRSKTYWLFFLYPKFIDLFSWIQHFTKSSPACHIVQGLFKGGHNVGLKTQYISYINTFICYIHSVPKNARYTSSSSVFTAFITYVGAQLRRKPLYSIVLLLKLFAKPLPKFQIIQMQLINNLVIQWFDYSISTREEIAECNFSVSTLFFFILYLCQYLKVGFYAVYLFRLNIYCKILFPLLD